MLSILFTFSLAECDYIYDVSYEPILIEKQFKAKNIICINSSLPGLAIILKKWDNSNLTTYHSAIKIVNSSDLVQNGPYEFSKKHIGAIDFGKSYGSIELHMRNSDIISFGAITFPNPDGYRIMSSYPKDNFTIFNQNENENYFLKYSALKFQPKMSYSYFNTVSGLMNYEINANLDNQILQINQEKSGTFSQKSISGPLKIEIQTENLIFFTCKSDIQSNNENLIIKIKSKIKLNRVSRFIGLPNGDYVEILSTTYSKSFFSSIFFIIVLFLLIIIIGISLFLYKKQLLLNDINKLLKKNETSDDQFPEETKNSTDFGAVHFQNSKVSEN